VAKTNGDSKQPVAVRESFVTNAPVRFEANPRMINLLELGDMSGKNPFERDPSVESNLSEEAAAIKNENHIVDTENGENEYDAESSGSSSSPQDDDASTSPIVTNTTLNIIRLFGKYVHMLSIFQIISNQVIDYLIQLYNFYFYYIYLDFAHEEVILPYKRLFKF
jgi:hypothetical protein